MSLNDSPLKLPDLGVFLNNVGLDAAAIAHLKDTQSHSIFNSNKQYT